MLTKWLILWLVMGVAGAIEVTDDAGLRAALGAAKPGDEILVKEGVYRGGIQVQGRSGAKDKPIVLRGLGEGPTFKGGGSTAMQFSDCSYWVLENLAAEGFPGNGINLDDGGTYATPSRGMRLRKLRIYRTGPAGNHDGIKLSGLVDFRLEGCTIAGWGGSAIDMVGCRDGRVSDCRLQGMDGYSQNSGIQMKGGTKRVLVEGCHFFRAGDRAVNLGGSTGLDFFRPKVGKFEAEEIELRDCVISGSETAVAFVGSRGGKVHHNLIVRPGKWALRILQEQAVPEFSPCQKGEFFRNVVVLPKDNRVVVNVGANTMPESFVFRKNAWFHEGGRHRVALPVDEEGGLYGVDPKVKEDRVRAAELEGFGPRNTEKEGG